MLRSVKLGRLKEEGISDHIVCLVSDIPLFGRESAAYEESRFFWGFMGNSYLEFTALFLAVY